MAWEDLLPVATLLVGAGLTEWAHTRREKRGNAREDLRIAAERQRQDRRTDVEFQRQTFLRVRDLVDEFEETLEAVCIPVVEAFKLGSPLPEHDEAGRPMRDHRTARRRLYSEVAAIEDDRTRSLGSEYLEKTVDAVQEPVPGASDGDRVEAIATTLRNRIPLAEELMQAIGEHLRTGLKRSETSDS